MAPLDAINIPDTQALKEARRNAREIRINIPKLIKILMKNRPLKDKLEKEFAA